MADGYQWHPARVVSTDRVRDAAHRVFVAFRPRHDWTLIFLHIPKTAGTSLRQAMGQAYEPDERVYLYDAPGLEGSMHPREFENLPEERRAQLRFVMGHLSYGTHRLVPHECRYVAVLRDPVDRVMSHYYHYRQVVPAKEGRAARERQMIEDRDLSLEDWVFGLQRIEADNQQVRAISGRPAVEYGATTDDMLAEAIEHIDAHFAMILFAEHMNRDLRRLGTRLGYAIPNQVRANVNDKRPGVDQLDPELRQRIRELNRLDVELYETMLERSEAESFRTGWWPARS